MTYAPSGRPLSAFANGSIAFTCKVSGVPDLLLTLRTSSGGGGGGGADRGAKVRRAMDRPVFHPCVRLARWRDHGELSFVPPDGRFVLAGYEVELLDSSAASVFDAKASSVNLPASIEVKTGLGPTGAEFEVRLLVNHSFAGGTSTGSGGGGGAGAGSQASASLSSHFGRPGGIGGGGALRSLSNDTRGGSTSSPSMEEVCVSIPVPASVRSLGDLRPSKGEAHWSPGDAAVEWRLSGKEAAGLGSTGAVLRCAVVGAADEEDEDDGEGEDAPGLSFANGVSTDTYDYDEDVGGGSGAAYQSSAAATPSKQGRGGQGGGGRPGETTSSSKRDARKARQNAVLMPSCATLSFGVKGWLASGLRVDSLVIDHRRSKGVGETVKPYKGVKYLTVSRGGVEVRC